VGTITQVFAAAVEAVAVYVIHFVSAKKNKGLHTHGKSSPIGETQMSFCVRFASEREHNLPMKLIKPIKIYIVNKGFITTGKLDFFHGACPPLSKFLSREWRVGLSRFSVQWIRPHLSPASMRFL
jgi:hypothetical protein